MDKSQFKLNFQNKLNLWGRDLSVLEDDTERADEDNKEEFQLLMQELMRDYEDLESRLNEIDEMSDTVFEDEKYVMQEMMDNFGTLLAEARSRITDV